MKVEATALDHESGHDSMEQGSGVEAFLGVLLEVGDADRRLGIVEFDDDGASRGLDGGVIRGRQLADAEDGDEESEDLQGVVAHRERSFGWVK